MATAITERPPVVIYTDGACKGNPGPGGWGAHMNNGARTLNLWGGEPDTTNNRMELLAAIKALEFFTTPRRLTIHSDSSYVVNGNTKWLPKWIANEWQTATGPVSNVDLWKRLQAAALRHEVSWMWVKSHSGNPGNDRADQLANRGLDRFLQKLSGVAPNV